MKIYLLGFMAAGKSTLGIHLGASAGVPFVDLDVEIAGRAGESISAIFARGGESLFRQLESATLEDLSGRQDLILATGGGVVERRANHTHLLAAHSVYLAWPWGILRERLMLDSSGTRPLNEGSLDDLYQRWENREPIYRQLARQIIDLGGADERAPRSEKLDEMSALILADAERGGQ
jgi:shikimate kinase